MDWIANPFTLNGLWVWIAAFLTLGAFSFLVKDNPWYKLTEHIFVGTAAGYFAALEFNTVLKPNLIGKIGHAGGLELVFYIFAAVFCIMMVMRLLPNIGWISRWPLSAMVGIYAGLGAIGALQGDFFPQVQASIISLRMEGVGAAAWVGYISNLLILLGVVTTLIFFYYSAEHRGALAWSAKVGMYFLMASFGAAYGFTVMGRISLLVGRLQFLLSEWLHLIRL